MKYSLSAVGGLANEIESNRAMKIGFICNISSKCPIHTQTMIGAFIGTIESAISLDQIKIYFNDYGECMGYVSWAFLSPGVERRFLGETDLSLDITEWNEGTSLWIVDAIFLQGSLAYILEDLRDKLFGDFDKITYYRIKNGRRIFKRISRHNGSSFFRK